MGERLDPSLHGHPVGEPSAERLESGLPTAQIRTNTEPAAELRRTDDQGVSRAVRNLVAPPFCAAYDCPARNRRVKTVCGAAARSAGASSDPAATPHTIQITGGASAYAMCAIDALGIAGMLHTSVLIRSTDPSNGEPVIVALDGSDAVWNPATTVVFVCRTADECAGPSAAICCDHVNFFTSHSTAEAWVTAHPEITGGILGQARSLEVAEQIFGQLLRLSESGLARAKGLGAIASSRDCLAGMMGHDERAGDRQAEP